MLLTPLPWGAVYYSRDHFRRVRSPHLLPSPKLHISQTSRKAISLLLKFAPSAYIDCDKDVGFNGGWSSPSRAYLKILKSTKVGCALNCRCARGRTFPAERRILVVGHTDYTPPCTSPVGGRVLPAESLLPRLTGCRAVTGTGSSF